MAESKLILDFQTPKNSISGGIGFLHLGPHWFLRLYSYIVARIDFRGYITFSILLWARTAVAHTPRKARGLNLIHRSPQPI